MIRRIDNIKFPIILPESQLKAAVEKKFRSRFRYFRILKKSLDARDKRNIFWLYSVAVSEREERTEERTFARISSSPAVAVVGGGPAGLFCAIRLIEHGFKPIIIERAVRRGRRGRVF